MVFTEIVSHFSFFSAHDGPRIADISNVDYILYQ